MLKKTLQLLKNNPVIILCYGIYLLISILILFLLYPKNFGVDTYTQSGSFDYSLYMVTMRNMLIALLLMFILGLFFASGYGGMLREAVFSGKTKLHNFLNGIKHYFGRVLLCALLTSAIVIVGSILIGILSIPFTVIGFGTDSIDLIVVMIMLITLLLVLIPSPFFILWMPALFLEDTGVFHSIKLGMKAGAKNYWKLLIATFLLILPQTIYSILNYTVIKSGSLFTLEYFVLLGIMSVLSLFYSSYVFLVYHEHRIGLITIQAHQSTDINS